MIRNNREFADFDTCAESVSRICQPYRLAAPSARKFRGCVRNFTAAGLNITELQLGRSRMSQDPAGPAGGGSPYFSLVVQLRGAARVQHREDEACLAPGNLVLLDSATATTVEVSEGSLQYSLNLFDAADRSRLAPLRAACGRVIVPGEGPAAVLADTLLSITRNADGLERLDLRQHAIDLILATFGLPAHDVADGAAIIRYIDTHLHLSTLDPRQVASHFRISLRQLYRLTAAHDATPAALIWNRRLLRARQALVGAGPASITDLAYQCGFKDSAHFARAYRRAFGESPSATRQMGRTTTGCA